MTQRVYLETTIPSYLTAWPSRDLIIAGHQQATKDWWRTRRDEFEICISQFVLDEAGAGDAEAAQERLAILKPLPLLDISAAVLELATEILQSGIIPANQVRFPLHWRRDRSGRRVGVEMGKGHWSGVLTRRRTHEHLAVAWKEAADDPPKVSIAELQPQ